MIKNLLLAALVSQSAAQHAHRFVEVEDYALTCLVNETSTPLCAVAAIMWAQQIGTAEVRVRSIARRNFKGATQEVEI